MNEHVARGARIDSNEHLQQEQKEHTPKKDLYQLVNSVIENAIEEGVLMT